MLKFIKNIFSTLIGILLSFFVIFLIIIGIVSLSSQSQSSTKKLDKKHFLKIDLSSEVVERESSNPFSSFDPMNIEASQQLGLKNILDNIEKAKNDDNIAGIYINSPIVNAGISKTEEIRNKLLEFKQTKKPIVAYNEAYGMKSYYLSSVADKLYINPMGVIDHKGMSATLMFFKGLLEKLNIDLQIFRLGKFKSAIEPFTLDKMSNSNREQVKLMLNSINNNIIDSIASQRKISKNKIHKDANQLKLSSAKICLEENYVDGILYEDQVKDTLKLLLGEDKLKLISLKKYSNIKTKKKEISRNKIAIIYANGGINTGKGDENSIGSITTSKAIEKARVDKKVKAIVLRVNSGGGSALASDVIWRETILAKKDKPLVVSFGDVAASGGYYIACAADKIIANPTSITGSIGVFGMIPNMNDFYKSNFGITFDTVKTNDYADMGIYRKLTSFEKQKIQQGIKEVYETFITKVGEGRRISKKQVDEIGQGRVWSGYDAKKIGLIDEFGGVEKAIELAAKLAELDEYRTISLPKQKDPFTEFIDDLTQTKFSNMLNDELNLINEKDFIAIKELVKGDKIQTRIPFILDLK